MKRNYYLFTNGRLKRKENTLWLETDAESKAIPVEDCEAVYAFAELDFNSKVMVFLAQQHIPVHFFNYYGYYSGSFMPRDYLVSGQLLVKQVSHYQQPQKRLEIARAFIDGASYNILKNLRYYHNRGKAGNEQGTMNNAQGIMDNEQPQPAITDAGDKKAVSGTLAGIIDDIEAYRNTIPGAADIAQLMGIEGNIRERYYSGFDQIVDLPFEKRSKQPPQNELNALLSFCNTLVYTTCLGELYRTQLNPTISFLHEPGDRRFSLSLDLAEIFKPILSERMIFSLLNKKQIQTDHFDQELNGCYLKENGRKIVLKDYNERLETTIHHRKLDRSVSYRRLIRLEAYKLVKHITGDEVYDPFKIWW